jgi:hypothetical protein
LRTLTFGLTAFAIALVACSDASNPAATGAGTTTSTKTSTGADGGSSTSSTSDPGDDDASTVTATGDDDSGSGTTTTTSDSGTSPVDSGTGSGKKDGGSDSGTSGDGTPMRQACTSSYGNALSGTFGRLDGYVVSVVLPGGSSKCNADSTHIHIQVLMGGDVYDVAVNVDGGFWYDSKFDLPDGTWSEGWHGSDGLNYVSLGAHSTDFASINQSSLVTTLETALASANHITAYGTTYTGSDSGTGIHDIHRQSTNKDGALFLDPTSATPRSLLFRFSTDSF